MLIELTPGVQKSLTANMDTYHTKRVVGSSRSKFFYKLFQEFEEEERKRGHRFLTRERKVNPVTLSSYIEPLRLAQGEEEVTEKDLDQIFKLNASKGIRNPIPDQAYALLHVKKKEPEIEEDTSDEQDEVSEAPEPAPQPTRVIPAPLADIDADPFDDYDDDPEDEEDNSKDYSDYEYDYEEYEEDDDPFDDYDEDSEDDQEDDPEDEGEHYYDEDEDYSYDGEDSDDEDEDYSYDGEDSDDSDDPVEDAPVKIEEVENPVPAPKLTEINDPHRVRSPKPKKKPKQVKRRKTKDSVESAEGKAKPLASAPEAGPVKGTDREIKTERVTASVYDAPSNLRDFLKENPYCLVNDALRYFSKREIQKQINQGRVILRKGRLSL